jgi:hypothetical protein
MRAKTTLRLFVTAALGLAALLAAPAIGQVSRLVVVPPTSGAYVGVFVGPQGGSPAEGIANLESQLGRKLALHLMFVGFDLSEKLASQGVKDDAANGRVTLVSWGCSHGASGGTATFQGIQSGSYDQVLDQDAAAFRAMPSHLFMVRFVWEMNLNVGNPRGNSNHNNCYSSANEGVSQAAAEYVGAYRHIVQRFSADGVRNVTWLWCPSGAPGNARRIGGFENLKLFYPGNAYVDWICFDSYPHRDVSMAETLGPFVSDFANYGKPILIGETGEINSAGPPAGRRISQDQYLSDLAAAIEPGGAFYPYVKGFCYFDSHPDNGRGKFNWTLDANGIAALKRIANSSFFGAMPSRSGSP